MSAPKLPVDLQWVAHTLTPYLRYAFQRVLRRNLDITPYIQRALDFSISKPGSYSDGDDLVFERVFFAIKRRHQDLPAEINGLTENLEPLAIFLIRRAQIKGPYELLGRDIPPSDVWKKYESERVMQIAAKNAKVVQNQKQPTVPTFSVPAAADPPAPPSPRMVRGLLLMNYPIDPRLLYASPGQFTAPELSGTLTLAELQYYHHRNKEIEASIARKLAQLPNQQQRYRTQHLVPGSQVIPQGYEQNRISPVQQGHHIGVLDGLRLLHIPNPAFQQPHVPSYVRHLGQQQITKPNLLPSHALVSTPQMYKPAQPTQRLFQQPGYLQPPGCPSRPAMQNIRQLPIPITSRPMPAQPVSFSTYHDSTHPGLPTLTKPAGISKSIPKAPRFPGLPDFSDPAQRATSMAAFRKLSREEKIAKFMELERAEKALDPNAIAQVQKSFIKAAAKQAAAAKTTAADGDSMKQNNGNAENTLKPPNQQAITVPAPGYQTHWDTCTTTSGVGSFGSHPGYSNITSSFPSIQFHGPLLAPEREE